MKTVSLIPYLIYNFKLIIKKLSMRRYFYNTGSLVSKWLENNAFAKAYEDQMYRSAFLAALKNDPSLKFN